MWTFAILCVSIILAMFAVLAYLLNRSMNGMFKDLNPLEGITEADWKQIPLGLERRYPLDYEVVVKAYGPASLLNFFGAVFDTNGDVVDITNKECFVRGFVSSLVELDGHLNSPASIRKLLGLNDRFYDTEYGGDIYVMTIDLSDQNLRFDFPVKETAGGLALFQEGGLTSGGAREVQILRDIPVWEKIVEIRRVCERGYGMPFTPNESSKHTILKYHRKNSRTSDIEPWNPWHDEDDSAWAVALLRLKTE